MNTHIKIRPAKSGDAEQIGSVHSASANKAYAGLLSETLLKALFSELALAAVAEKNIAASIERPDLTNLAVAEDNRGRIVGFAHSVMPNDHDDAGALVHFMARDGIDTFEDSGIMQFKTIYIAPGHQKHGLGTEFLYDAATSPMAENSDIIFTETLDRYEASPKFFGKFGAKKIGSYDVSVSDHYKMDNKSENDEVLTSSVYAMEKKRIIDTVRLNVMTMEKKNILGYNGK